MKKKLSRLFLGFIIVLLVAQLPVFEFCIVPNVYATTYSFGYTTIGTYGYQTIENQIDGTMFTAPKSGNATSMFAAIRWTSAAWTGKIKTAIYYHGNLSLLAATTERTIALTNVATWYQFNFINSPPIVANTEYLLEAWAESKAGTCCVAYDMGDTNQEHYKSALAYDGFPDPFAPLHYDEKLSIYCILYSPITLNTAGNPSEAPFASSKFRNVTNRFYRNGTLQTEDWMYINSTIIAENGISCAYVEWKNSTTWKNYTMTNQAGTDYWYKNMTNQAEYDKYTFNIHANDTTNRWFKYIWKFYDYEVGWGTEEQYRKFVGLSYETTTSFEYKILHFLNYTYTEQQLFDYVLPHEQCVDGTIRDTGLMSWGGEMGNYSNWCNSFAGYFMDEDIKAKDPIIIKDIYVHMWWSSYYPYVPITVAYGKDWDYAEHFHCSSDDAKDSHNFTFGLFDTYYLEVTHWNISDVTFTDNDINLFGFYVDTSVPSVVSQAADDYLQTFIIFNLPSNATLQGLDSDYDGVNDYDELFVNYTCPFLLIPPSEYSRSASQSLTFSLVASRLFEIIRPITQAIGITLSGTRLFDITRPSSLTISALLATSRIGEFFKAASQTITVSLSSSRIADFFRATTQAITTSFQTSRLGEWFRSASQSITASLTANRLIDIARGVSQTIGVSTISSRLAEFARTVSQTFNIGFTTTRIAEFFRSVSQTITTTLNVARLGEFVRSASQTIGLSLQGIGEKIGLYFRDAILTITTSFQASRLAEWFKSASQTVTFAFSTQRLTEFTRIATQSIGLSLQVTAETITSYFRNVALTITTSLESLRQIDVIRQVSQTLNFVLQGLGSLLHEFMRDASLFLSVKVAFSPEVGISLALAMALIVVACVVTYAVAKTIEEKQQA